MVGSAPQAQATRVGELSSPATASSAAGTELLGEYEASAFSQPQYLLRRSDGQVIQLTRLLYLVLSALDSGPGTDVVAQVSAQLGRPVSVDNINYLIDQKLAPLGVIATGNAADQDGDAQAAPSLTRPNPLLLGLRYRTRVVPERLHRGRVSGAEAPVLAAAGPRRPRWLCRLRRLAGDLAGLRRHAWGRTGDPPPRPALGGDRHQRGLARSTNSGTPPRPATGEPPASWVWAST